MANFVYITLTLIWMSLCWWNTTVASPSTDDELYFDRQLNRELLNKWISSVRNAQMLNNPCRNSADNTWASAMPKRNSELINSLLSLPKSMNDAGK
ncbi:protein PDF-like [Stomoxys calcitrans]|uniref:Pigment dispersing factor n=1 Tax=Stomoxys calcitrans TaxID=35570 RepID=A0A1I8NVA4_STOCA|nr:protein PDF-like [Stomoxys calcitrans]